uniref:Titin-cap n=1 Tax=Serinus canaria TaxID=9135 RepID=A0A8C9ME83_SERCA
VLGARGAPGAGGFEGSPGALREGYEHFDPRAYLRNNYLPPRADFSSEEFVVPWKLRCLAETFASGEIRGRTLIDVGSGPTIYQLLSACDHFEEIVATDYLAVDPLSLSPWILDWSHPHIPVGLIPSPHACLD